MYDQKCSSLQSMTKIMQSDAGNTIKKMKKKNCSSSHSYCGQLLMWSPCQTPLIKQLYLSLLNSHACSLHELAKKYVHITRKLRSHPHAKTQSTLREF